MANYTPVQNFTPANYSPANGSLQNTMTKSKVSAPPAPKPPMNMTPSPAENQRVLGNMQQQTVVPPAPVTPPQAPPDPGLNGAGSNTNFMAAMAQYIKKANENAELVSQKNTILQALFDSPPTEDQLGKLPYSEQQAIRSNSTDLMKLSVSLINDKLQSRVNNVTNSISYLLKGYQMDQELASQKRKEARDEIESALDRFGSSAFRGLSPESRRQLESNAGFESGYLDKLPPTLSEKKTSGTGTGGGGGTGKVSPVAQAVIDGVIRLEDLTPTVRGQIAPELATAGYKSGPKLSSGQQDDIASMDVLTDQLGTIENYFPQGLEGIGGFGLGSLKQFLSKNLGISTEEGNQVRAVIGNIKGTIAKLRGGTSFTPNEEKLLETYTPGINETPSSILSKIAALKTFLASKKNALLNAAQNRGIENIILEGTTPSGIRFKVTQ